MSYWNRFCWLWAGWCMSATLFLILMERPLGAVGNALGAVLMVIAALRAERYDH